MTIFITSFFYLLSTLFIWVEIFGFLNRDKVFKRIDFERIDKLNLRLYLFFYLSKLFYIVWMFSGLFTNFYFYFISLIFIGFFRNFVVLTNSRVVVNSYDFLNPFVSSIILLFILFQGLFQ